MVKERFLRDFLVDVPHDHGQIGLELLRRAGRHHKQPLAAKVLLVPGQQQLHVVLASHPDEPRNGPFRALLLLQEVNLQHRGRLIQVCLQLVLLGRRRNVFHVNEQLSVHCTGVSEKFCGPKTRKILLYSIQSSQALLKSHYLPSNLLK